LATAGRTGDVTISTVGSWTNVITVDSWARNAYVTYTLVDSDLSTAEAQAWTKTFKFASVEPEEEFEASISKSRFTVTADFGVAFKGKKISIVVENVATGSVVTYSRKANSLGKVSYTIGRRGTFEIYAMSGDALTDTVVVKR
jgi:O6-methylguanine-DNA--protein-cysteine methyltransferase